MPDSPVFHEWSGKSINDRVDLVFLQIQNGVRPEVEWIGHQMLDKAGVAPGDTAGSIEALFWGFKEIFHYLPDPWELDLFTNFYRAWLIGGGSPDGDLSQPGEIMEDCDGSVEALGALIVSTARRTGIRGFGAEVLGPKKEFVHILAGALGADRKVVYLDPTVSSAGPGWRPPARFRNVDRFVWFNPRKQYAPRQSTPTLNDLALHAPDLRDLERASPRSRIKSIVRRTYRNLRDPLVRVSAVTMLREMGCEPRDDTCDATSVLRGVQQRWTPTAPIGGTLRTMADALDSSVGDAVGEFGGDEDDCITALCSLALSIGFRSGVRTLPDGSLCAVVQTPRTQTQSKPKRVLDLSLESDRPIQRSGGNIAWYSEAH